MTTQLETLQQLYEAYTQKARTVLANKKFGEGLFGFGGKAADDPCHMQFVADVRALLENDLPTDDAALCELLTWMLHMADGYDKIPSIYWTLIAAQGAALPLIPRLAPTDAAALHDSYKRAYNRWSLLPVQSDILRQLDKARKAKR